ncbi:MAG: DUF4190 domain-containing protein [Porcipelethomonas sp.]
MTCSNCGKEIRENVSYCPLCGSVQNIVTKNPTQQNVYATNQNQYTSNTYSNPKKVPFNPMCITGFVIGLVSLFIGIMGIVGIIAVIFSSIGMSQSGQKHQRGKGMAISGLVTGIVSIVYGIFQILFLF